MHRFARWFAALACAVSLLGASSGFGVPAVVVYPITATGTTDPAAGGNISLLIATKISQLGGITVKPAIPGTERTKFLDAASAVGADYYVTGFLTPIGADSSLIVQVVSTYSGSVVYSTTAVVRTYADAVAQADAIRAAILRHAGRGLAALDAPPPAPSSSPAPVANAGNVDIGKALRKRGKAPAVSAAPAAANAPASPAAANVPVAPNAALATPTPTSTRFAAPPATAAPAAQGTAEARHALARAVPSTTAASDGALLFVAGGALDDATRAYATNALANALRRAGIAVGELTVRFDDRVSHARAICDATPGTTVLYVPTLIVGSNDTSDPSAQIDVASYDCDGNPIASRRALASARKRAGTDAAIDAAATSLAAGLAKARR